MSIPSATDVIPPITRDPVAAADERFDLLIVGGGIQGIMLALEATRRRLRPLLVERGDFAAGTSYNSLRILHGGLRYLQSLDFRRSAESIRERAWWLRWFPDLVRPLPCLMPLYGEGLRRAPVMRAGLKANDVLAALLSGPADPALPPGRIISADEVRGLFPHVAPRGLQAGALWHDAWAPEAPRLCLEALRWACNEGAVALNYVEARRLMVEDDRVRGVHALDLESGATLALQAPVVVNAAGAEALAFLAGSGLEARLPPPVLAWNVCFRRSPLSTHGLAVKRPGDDCQTHFVLPWKGGLCAGTPYALHLDGARAGPSQSQLRAFIDDLNGAVPGLELTLEQIAHVYAGLLPAAAADGAAPAERPAVIDHGRSGGPAGLISLVTPKLTTARSVADRLLAKLFPGQSRTPDDERRRPPAPPAFDVTLDWAPGPDDDAWLHQLTRAHARDSALHLDDLLLRHAPLGDDPGRALRLALPLADALGFAAERRERELVRLREALRPRFGPLAREPRESHFEPSRRAS